MATSELMSIGFPFALGNEGIPSASSSVTTIRDSLRALLLTGVGERVMRPDLGTKAHEYVFENMSTLLMARISNNVAEAISTFEPRAKLIRVDVVESADTELTIIIQYKSSGMTQEISVEVSPTGGQT